MNQMKRVLAMFLVLAMMLGIMPAGAIAAETGEETTAPVAEVAEDSASTKPADGTTENQPFPANTADSANFRIPAMVTLSSGRIVAAVDARWNTFRDGGGLDTIVSYSDDQGATWNYTFANYMGDNGNTYNAASSTAFIDPALTVKTIDSVETIFMLVDLYPYGVALNGDSGYTTPSTALGFDSQNRLLLSNNNHTSYDYYLGTFTDGTAKIYKNDGTVVEGYTVDAYYNIKSTDGTVDSNLFFADSPFKVVRTGYLYLTKSTDGGKTWSAPLLIPNVKTDAEQVCLVGPGRGLVTSDGTIMFSCYSYNNGNQVAGVLYSTDNGATWNRSNVEINVQSSENQLVQLDNGTIRMFFRNWQSQVCYVDGKWDNGALTWNTNYVATGVYSCSNTMMSAIRYSKTIDGKQAILISYPASSSAAGNSSWDRVKGRIAVGLVQDDGTMEWIQTTEVNNDNFWYSCLSELSDGSVGLLYETGANGTTVNYTAYSIDTLVDLQVSDDSGAAVQDVALVKAVGAQTYDVSGVIQGQTVTVTSGNETVVTASLSGTVLTLTPVATGTTTVTLTIDGGDSVTLNVTVEDYLTRSITLKAGETVTDESGNYENDIVQAPDSLVSMTVVGSEEYTEKQLVPIESVTELVDGEYLIYNNRAGELLTDEAASEYDGTSGLLASGAALPDSEELWAITASGGQFLVAQNNSYLSIGHYNVSMTEAETSLSFTYEDGHWLIYSGNYYLSDIYGAFWTGISGYDVKDDGGNYWTIYQIVDVTVPSSTDITFTGERVGQTTAIVGSTKYTITVEPVEVDVELYVGESAEYTAEAGNNAGTTVTDPDDTYVTMTVSDVEKTLEQVTSADQLTADGEYLIVSKVGAQDYLLTDDAYNGNIKLLQLKQETASADSTEIWTIIPVDADENSYKIMRGDLYLFANYSEARMIDETGFNKQGGTKIISTGDGLWAIASGVVWGGTNYYFLNNNQNLYAAGPGDKYANTDTIPDSATRWTIYKIVDTITAEAPTVTFTGVSEGQTTALVGNTKYNITVSLIQQDVSLNVGQTVTYTETNGANSTPTVEPTGNASVELTANADNGTTTVAITGVAEGTDTVVVGHTRYNITVTQLRETVKVYVPLSETVTLDTAYTNPALVTDSLDTDVAEVVLNSDNTLTVTAKAIGTTAFTLKTDAGDVIYTVNTIERHERVTVYVGQDVTIDHLNGNAVEDFETEDQSYVGAEVTDGMLTISGKAASTDEIVIRVGSIYYYITVKDPTETVDVTLYVGETITLTNRTGEYDENDIGLGQYKDGIITYSIASGMRNVGTPATELVDGMAFWITSDRKQDNNKDKYVLTSQVYGNGLLLDGTTTDFEDADFAETGLWYVEVVDEDTFGLYQEVNGTRKYLNIGSSSADMSGTADLKLEYDETAGYWRIIDTGTNMGLNQHGGGDNVLAAGYSSYDDGNRWNFYEAYSYGYTDVTFKGVTVGETTIVVGNTTYNVTVKYQEENITLFEGMTVRYDNSGTITTASDGSVATTKSENDGLTIKAVSEGTTTAVAGTVQYNITVRKPENPFLAGTGVGTSVTNAAGETYVGDLTKLTLGAGLSFNVDLLEIFDDAEVTWTIANTNVATVDGNGVVTGVAEGETMLTATINGVAFSIPVAVVNLNTENADSTKIFDFYADEITNTDVYYVWNCDPDKADIKKLQEGEAIYVQMPSGSNAACDFFGDPNEGHALTRMSSTNSDSAFFLLHDGTAEKNVNTGSNGFYNGTAVVNGTTVNGAGKAQQDQFGTTTVDGVATDNLKITLENVIEIGCDGGMGFTRLSNNPGGVSSTLTFRSEKLPTVTKTVDGILGSSGLHSDYRRYNENTSNMVAYEGETIYFKITVTHYAAEDQIDYTNVKLTDGLTGALWYDLAEPDNKNLTRDITDALNADGLNYAEHTYYVTYKVTKADVQNYVNKGTKITNTVGLNYDYQAIYSSGGHSVASTSVANMKLSAYEPKNIVIDFGLPATVFNADDNWSLGLNPTGSATFGTVQVAAVTVDGVEGWNITYTPTSVLTAADTAYVTSTDKDGNVTAYAFTVYPASIVYYEEDFALKNNPTGFAVQTTGNNNGTSTQQAQYAQSYNTANTEYYVFGYDAAYEDDTAGPSNGTEAVSTAIGDNTSFLFHGTGIDIYANSSATTGAMTVAIYQVTATDDTGAITGKKLVKMCMVDTNITGENAGAAAAYNLPIVSAQDLSSSVNENGEAATYLVQIRHTMRVEYDENGDPILDEDGNLVDNTTSVRLDGFRIYDTLGAVNTTTTQYDDYRDHKEYPTSEHNPVFVELRNEVLAGLKVTAENVQSIYDNGAVFIDQVFEVSGDPDDQTGAVVISKYGTSADLLPEHLGVVSAESLLNDGPKNELFLESGESLVFTLSSGYSAQIGTKAANEKLSYSVQYKYTDVTENGTVEDKTVTDTVDALKSSTEMYRHNVKGMVTITNNGPDILSITQLKLFYTPVAEAASWSARSVAVVAEENVDPFEPITVQSLRYALRAVGAVNEPQVLQVAESVQMYQGDQTTVELQLLPAEAGAGKTLTVSSSNPSVAEVVEQTVTADAEGKAVITLSALTTGYTEILLTLESADIETAVMVAVEEEPTEATTEAPTETPTEAPTEEPTEAPTEKPTEEPTEAPTEKPTEEPTEKPTEEPTEEPTETPTEAPTEAPTEEPTEKPTEEPTGEPTEEPTGEPTEEPTEKPTEEPTEEPTGEPTEAPTEEPTEKPTEAPTEEPMEAPTEAPTEEPTEAPTEEPTDTPTEEPVRNPFADVTEADYFYAPVLWAVSKGVTAGVDETHFAPANACTRAQIVTFLWANAGKPEPETTENPFVDVQETDWFYKAVLWAVENGITAGVDSRHFAPGLICTRAQTVTFLYAAAGKPDTQASGSFADVAEDAWYAEAVAWAVAHQITAGVGNGMFGPISNCTRGQIVTFLYAAYGK